MRFGIHYTPFIPPTRNNADGFNWIVDSAVLAEQAGLDEFWVGQHHSVAWEPVPGPELVLSAVLRETSKITVAAGGHQTPYYHPTMLASQAAWLSNIAQGRYILGLATGVNPGDSRMHGFGDMSKHLAMTVESIEIMRRFFADEDFTYEGEFWNASYPKDRITGYGPGGHQLRSLRPWGGEMPIALTAGSPRSSSVKVAGELGLIPLSFAASADAIAQQWETYVEAAQEAGRETIPDTSIRRVAMDVFVAETDAEAARLVKDGPIGFAQREHMDPRSKTIIMRETDPGVTPLDVDEMLTTGRIIAGSPDTVAVKLNEWLDHTGGWGTTLVHGYDYSDDPEPWKQSMKLLVEEVGPQLIK